MTALPKPRNGNGPDGAGGRSVLVVEDDPSISLGLRINLEKEGYRVLVESDGERGLDAARTRAPDLIILDVMLPNRNGFEVLHTLRQEGYSMPIIVLSARSAGVLSRLRGNSDQGAAAMGREPPSPFSRNL